MWDRRAVKASTIGDIARRSGVAQATLRYYESLGLLTPPVRSASGYRHYTTKTLDELLFIRGAQALGFSLAEIRGIIGLARSGRAPCARVLALARERLAATDEQLRQMQNFRDWLASEVARWQRRGPASVADGLCALIAESTSAVSPAAAEPPPRLMREQLRRRRPISRARGATPVPGED